MTGVEVPGDYAGVLADLKERVRQARYQAQRRVNTELISLYWQIGRVLVAQTEQAEWGDKVIDRLSADLRAEFDGAGGFSVRNLKYMRSFARAWTTPDQFGQQAVAQLPWGHITVLLDKLDDADLRNWYCLASGIVSHFGVGIRPHCWGLADPRVSVHDQCEQGWPGGVGGSCAAGEEVVGAVGEVRDLPAARAG